MPWMQNQCHEVKKGVLILAAVGVLSFWGCGKDCSSPAQGCPCDPLKDRPFCASEGYSCEGGHWVVGPDGPCVPIWDGGYSKDVAMSIDIAEPADGAGRLDSSPAVDGLTSYDVSTAQ